MKTAEESVEMDRADKEWMREVLRKRGKKDKQGGVNTQDRKHTGSALQHRTIRHVSKTVLSVMKLSHNINTSVL